jgi:hypothetical protein
MPTHDELLIEAYQGEVLGEALFAALAERCGGGNADADRRAKLDVLTRLERATKDAMRPALERRGIDTAPDAGVLETAARFADTAAAMQWRDLLASFEPTTKKYVEVYEGLGAAGEDAQLVELLLRHERALAEFARRELGGDAATSMQPILDLPHVAASPPTPTPTR